MVEGFRHRLAAAGFNEEWTSRSGMNLGGRLTAALGVGVVAVAVSTLPAGRRWTPWFSVIVFGIVFLFAGAWLPAVTIKYDLGVFLTGLFALVGLAAGFAQIRDAMRNRPDRSLPLPEWSHPTRHDVPGPPPSNQ